MSKQSKLTLSVKSVTVRRAKIYAREKKTSITRLVEEYLDRLTETKKDKNSEEFLKSLHPSVQAITGIVTGEELKKAKSKLRLKLKKKYA